MLELNGRRSPLDIVADILRLLRLEEAGRTEIMYTIGMSYHQLQKYLSWLLELELMDRVTGESGSASYRITEKGLRLLTQIENVGEMLKRYEAPELTKRVSSRPHGRVFRFWKR